MPNVRHVSFSSSGGAGLVASQLVSSLPKFGYDAELDVVTPSDIGGVIASHPLIAATTIVDNFVIKRKNSRQLFSLTRTSPRRSRGAFRRDDVVHLHWTPGALDLGSLVPSRFTKPIVWTMHDMWPITGGCHHAVDCTGFTDNCIGCPVVRPVFRFAVQRSAESKRVLLHALSKLVICAPSKWLVKQIASSSVARGLDVRFVPNPIDPVFSDAEEPVEAPSHSLTKLLDEIPRDAFVVGFVAKNLNDSNKRIDLAIEASRRLSTDFPSRNIVMLAIGNGNSQYADSGIDLRRTGFLDSAADRRFAYRTMDVLLAVSDAETAPLVINEALACGTPVIVRDNGGAAEAIEHGRTGLVCDSLEEIRLALVQLLTDETARQRMGSEARSSRSHALDTVLKTYVEIYSELITD